MSTAMVSWESGVQGRELDERRTLGSSVAFKVMGPGLAHSGERGYRGGKDGVLRMAVFIDLEE